MYMWCFFNNALSFVLYPMKSCVICTPVQGMQYIMYYHGNRQTSIIQRIDRLISLLFMQPIIPKPCLTLLTKIAPNICVNCLFRCNLTFFFYKFIMLSAGCCCSLSTCTTSLDYQSASVFQLFFPIHFNSQK